MAARTYPAVGRCIYCGAATYNNDPARRLAREHVIALAFGGDLILPEASCEACEIVTKNIEGALARGLFLAARTKLGMPTRRKKERPTHLPIDVETDQGVETRSVDIAKYPGLLLQFAFDPPGLLAVIPPTELFAGRVSMSQLPGFNEGLAEHGGKVTVNVNADSTVYARMLAKIAHGFAVAEYGINTFEPFLPDLILNKPPVHLASFIGGHPSTDNPALAEFYQISTRVDDWGSLGRLITVTVRLFANRLGSPSYLIVAGRK